MACIYDSNDIFLDAGQTMDLPCIKLRKNAKVRQKTNHILRNLAVISQKNDLLQKWKDRQCKLWEEMGIVETVFSCIKRRFDREYMFTRLNLKIW